MFPIAELSNIEVAFPASVSKIMPAMKDIPADFPNKQKWHNLFGDWFYLGLESLELKPREGVNVDKAKRHLKAVMSSFEPKHEHKEAAVAFLLSEWFEDATWVAMKAK